MDRITHEILSKHLCTPSYLFDIDAFAHRVRCVTEAFGRHTKLCFSIKANPFPLPYLPGEFDKIEVCSPGELTICEKNGIDMENVIFSGVNKTRDDVARAMEDGVGIFTSRWTGSDSKNNRRIPVQRFSGIIFAGGINCELHLC